MKINEVIRQVGDKYRLYSKKGKNLGTFDSKSAAEKHEREVQYFKHMKEQGQDALLTSPENTLVIDTPSDLDWYKLGQHISTIMNYDPEELGAGGSDTVMTFANREEMEKLMAYLDSAGIKYADISGTTTHPEVHTKSNVDDQ